jgi:hypothetical protein
MEYRIAKFSTGKGNRVLAVRFPFDKYEPIAATNTTLAFCAAFGAEPIPIMVVTSPSGCSDKEFAEAAVRALVKFGENARSANAIANAVEAARTHSGVIVKPKDVADVVAIARAAAPA